MENIDIRKLRKRVNDILINSSVNNSIDGRTLTSLKNKYNKILETKTVKSEKKKLFGLEKTLLDNQKKKSKVVQSKDTFLNHLPQIEKHEMYKNKKSFNRVVKTPYDVFITLHERHIYKDGYRYQGTEKETSYQRQTIIASSLENLKEKVNEQVDYIQYPIEESPIIRELASYDYTINNKPRYKKTDRQDVPMREAFPYTASFLKHFNGINPISYKANDGECVIQYLESFWGVGPKFGLRQVMEEASQKYYGRPYKKKNGITCKMIKY